MRRLIRALYLILWGISPSAFACGCGDDYPNWDRHYAKAKFVFLAEIVRTEVVETHNGRVSAIRAHLRVDEVFKGDVPQVTTLVDRDAGTSCAGSFQSRYKRYLFFVVHDGFREPCTGNLQLSDREGNRAAEERVFGELRALKTDKSR